MEIKTIRKSAAFGALGILVYQTLDVFKRFNTLPKEDKISACFNTIKEKANRRA
jgi:hypothetical protein